MSWTYKVFDFDDVERLPAPRYIVDKLITEKSITLLYGPPNVGKSLVALDLTLDVIRGSCQFADQYKVCTPRNVIYFFAEGAEGLGKRLRAMWKQKTHNATQTDWAEAKGRFKAVNGVPIFGSRTFCEEWQGFLGSRPELATRVEGALIIIDTLSYTLADRSESVSNDMAALLEKVRYVIDKHNCSVLLIHHGNKQENRGMNNVRGSTVLPAIVEMAFSLKRNKNVYYMTQEKARDSAYETGIAYQLALSDPNEPNNGVYLKWLKEGEIPRSKATASIPPVVKAMNQHNIDSEDSAKTASEIAALEEVTNARSTVSGQLKRLAEQKLVQTKNNDRGYAVYWVPAKDGAASTADDPSSPRENANVQSPPQVQEEAPKNPFDD